MSTARQLHHTHTEYLVALRDSDLKLEFCNGEIYAMAGGTPAHAELGAAAIIALKTALKHCSVFTSDLKIRIDATDLFTFPDATVVCGPKEMSSIDALSLTNPTLIVEVTSRSTEDYDRGNKLAHYQRLPSLSAVLLISHREPKITLVSRTKTGWHEASFGSGQTLSIDDPTLQLKVDDVYAGIALDPQA